MALVASRSYLSGQGVDGPVGVGWSTSVVSRVYYAAYMYTQSAFRLEAVVVMPEGARWTYTDNGNGTWSPPVGRHDTFVRNADGSFDLTIQKSRTKFHYASTGALSTLTDAYGNTLSYTYDGNGRIQQIADLSGSGRLLTVGWGADGRIATVQDNSGRIVRYAYDAPTGTLTTVTDAASRITTYGYVQGRLGKLLHEIGITVGGHSAVVSDVTYDSSDRVQSYTDRDETYTYAYDNPPGTVRKTNLANYSWQYTYLLSGLITDRQMSSLTGVASHVDYYSDYSVQMTTDGVGVKTYFTYDAQGNPSQVTKDYQGPLAVRYDYAYDPAYPGQVTSVTPRDPGTGAVDPDWQAWRYDYYQTGAAAPGALYHVYRVRDDGTSLDTLATYEYNAHGQVTKYTNATGGVTDYAYDAQGNLRTVTSPGNNAGRGVTTYGYDSVGRVTSVTDALNHATSYTYDNADRVATATLPKPSVGSPLTFTTSYSYDNYDASTGFWFTNVTDPNGVVTKQGYDQFGQLRRSVDGQSNVTAYGYTKGYLTSITDANNNVTSYGYDAGNRLTSVSYPDGRADIYTYQADDRVATKQDRTNQLTFYTYDNLKRLTVQDSCRTERYTFTGQKLTQVDDTVSGIDEVTLISYDHSYRQQTVTAGARGTLGYLYNADDTIQSASVQSGPSTGYTYYADGSVNTIAWSPIAQPFTYAYTLTGQYQTLTLASGATRNYTYDDQGRLTLLTNLASGGATLASYAYGYDHNYTSGLDDRKGQRVGMTATVPSQGLSGSFFQYEYDTLYQLKKVTYPTAGFSGEIDSWTYDSIGNRWTSTVNGVTQNLTYQKIGANPLNWQRLTNDGTNAYTYDNYGNVLTRGTYTFNWNCASQLTSITGTSSYGYDYQGRRTTRTVGSSTNTYLYDGLNLIQEQGATSADYVFGPGIDEPLAMKRGTQIYYYVVDGLGSVTEVTNASGTVQNAYLYDAWGQTKTQTGSLTNPFTYTAREQAEASTLYYRARYYQPAVGRFVSEDPIALRGGLNLYAYVLSSPADDSDPAGLASRREKCEKAASNLIGILKQAKHHEGKTYQGWNEICPALQKHKKPFEENECDKHFPSLRRQYQYYIDKYCKPPNCPQTSPAGEPQSEGEPNPNPLTAPVPVPVMPLPEFPVLLEPVPVPVPLPVPL